MMTKQEIFDVVSVHLVTQNGRSMRWIDTGPGRRESVCVYRGKDGKKCAVGALIDDADYDPKMENHDATSDVVLKALKHKIGREMVFVLELQLMHDSAPITQWPMQLAGLARRYNLSYDKMKDAMLQRAQEMHRRKA